MIFLLLILAIIVIIFVVKSANHNADDDPTVQSVAFLQNEAREHSNNKSNLSPQLRTEIDAMFWKSIVDSHKLMPLQQLLKDVLITNLQCLPKPVLEMEFTQLAIHIFILHYAGIVLTQKHDDPKQIGMICKIVIQELHEKGVILQKDFDPKQHFLGDPLYLSIPVAIKMFAQQPVENQTGLLVVIEKNMERELGHRVRYYGQRPADNPLNKQG